MRQYSEQELNQIAEAEQELDTKHGLMLLDNSPSAKANASLLNEYFNDHSVAMSVSSSSISGFLRNRTEIRAEKFALAFAVDLGLGSLGERRYAVTESGLDMALTNVQNNSSRKLFWHEGPKQDRAIWNGKLNHALNQKDEPAKPTEPVQEFHPNGRRNHAFKANTDEPRKPEPKVDAWKQVADLRVRQWTTHGQQATLQAEYDRGIETGKSWREIGSSLGQIVKGWKRGR
jgi:hypothetical protein